MVVLTASLAALALASGLAAGCGGGETDATAGLSPTQILERSRRAAEATGSYVVTIEGSSTAALRAGARPGGLAALLAGPVRLSGEGRIRRGAMALDAEVTAGGLPVQASLTLIDDGLYLSLLGRSFRLQTPPGRVAAIEPARLASALLGWVASPREVTREKVDGTRTVHLRGEVDPAALGDIGGIVALLTGHEGGRATAKLRAGTIDVWVGTADLLPRRVRVSLVASGIDPLPAVRRLTLDATVGFRDYGAEVRIEAPAGAQPVRPEDLGALAR
jgi:hypothetical protein